MWCDVASPSCGVGIEVQTMAFSSAGGGYLFTSTRCRTGKHSRSRLFAGRLLWHLPYDTYPSTESFFPVFRYFVPRNLIPGWLRECCERTAALSMIL